MPYKRYKGRGLFKRSKTELEALQTKQKLKMEERKKNQIKRLKKKLDILEGDQEEGIEKKDEGVESVLKNLSASVGKMEVEKPKNQVDKTQ